MATHIGVGGRVDPPNTRRFSQPAVKDYFKQRMVDDRFVKRVTKVLKHEDQLNNKTLRFTMPADQYFFFDLSNLILELTVVLEGLDGKTPEPGTGVGPVNNVRFGSKKY